MRRLFGRRRRPALTAEDRALWEHATRDATPMPRGPERPRATPEARRPPDPPARPLPSQPPEPRVLKPVGRAMPPLEFRHGEPRPAPVGRPEPGLDRRTAERLRRGDRTPDARIDLHGLTAERAHARLDAFLREAIRAGHRCVLVITGKGRRTDRDDAPFMGPEAGVLRDAAPRWLRSGPNRGRIVGIYEAHRRHGGEGAFYVYLKRGR